MAPDSLHRMQAFIVRVWTPRDGDEIPSGVRGTAVHLASGREIRFADGAALIEFLRDAGSFGAATVRGRAGSDPLTRGSEPSDIP
jgi:hypothetical protein